MSKTCPKCGREFDSGKYCLECGALLTGEEARTNKPLISQSETCCKQCGTVYPKMFNTCPQCNYINSEPEKRDFTQSLSHAPKRQKNQRMVLVVSALILLLVTSVSIYLYSSGSVLIGKEKDAYEIVMLYADYLSKHELQEFRDPASVRLISGGFGTYIHEGQRVPCFRFAMSMKALGFYSDVRYRYYNMKNQRFTPDPAMDTPYIYKDYNPAEPIIIEDIQVERINKRLERDLDRIYN